MKGVAPKTPALFPTDQTRQFARQVRARAHAGGRVIPSRSDWLVTLLQADQPYLSTLLIHEIGADATVLAISVDTTAHGADAWLSHSTARFLQDEIEPVARELGHGYIGTEHVLLAFTRAPGALGDQLRDAGFTWDRVRSAFDAIQWVSPAPDE